MGEDEILMLQSNDGRIVTVPKSVALLSETIGQALESASRTDMTPIPLFQVNYNTLKKLVAWMVRHAQINPSKDCQSGEEEGKHDGKASCILDWEREEFDSMDRNELFALMNAANYLGVSPLSRSSAAFVAEKLQTMSVEDAREYLSLVDDFTDEERDKIRQETLWTEKRCL
ncbi:unnamed protein product [Enterobius vermicularis]|uniref:Skp1-related protein n=1 Tax=Enterobius vermicularis TaxID=51028 RepID=A0A0N4VKM1_ENTVE|nr:unnamed protein product [Enterobius vermicularis]